MYMSQPAAQQIPPRPVLADADTVALRSVIIGVEVVAIASSNPDSIFLAEAILAALESFLSTSLAADVFPYKERLEFTVRPADQPTASPSIQLDETTTSISITHGAGQFGGASDYPTLINWLQEVLILLATSMMLIRDPKTWLERIAGDEIGFGRALGLSAVGIASRNLFGATIRGHRWVGPVRRTTAARRLRSRGRRA